MRLTNGQCTYVEASAGGTCQLTPQGGFATDSVTGVPVAFTLARMSAADAQTTKAGLGDRDDFDAPDQTGGVPASGGVLTPCTAAHVVRDSASSRPTWSAGPRNGRLNGCAWASCPTSTATPRR